MLSPVTPVTLPAWWIPGAGRQEPGVWAGFLVAPGGENEHPVTGLLWRRERSEKDPAYEGSRRIFHLILFCRTFHHGQNVGFHLHAWRKLPAAPKGIMSVSCIGRRSEKPGNEPEEVKLQKASKQIVQNVILQAVQQVSQESQQREGRRGAKEGSFRLGVGELTKKHEKK
ncbi:A-kinase anchor protein inhibitor 1 isoform X2 [Suricata suricatta]|nr:A-kinase anchor protein inhibitor 1 isoform X2 [Suricata suricatta]XP_029778037.1 A-kinase anchor protein inhibitor 1 isoform X2 [Suricata suricatta]